MKNKTSFALSVMRANGTQLFFGAFVAISFFVAAPLPTQANHCDTPFMATGYFFDNFQNAEYVNNLLVLHFKLQTSYNDGRSWISNLRFLSDECQRGNADSFAQWVSLTPGLQHFSVRFTSLTHFEIWNDETNTKEPCAHCSQDVPLYPGYYEFMFTGTVDGNSSILQSSSYRIRSDAADPPVITGTLSAPPNCLPFQDRRI